MTVRTRFGESLTGKSRIVVFGQRLGNFHRLCIRSAAASSLAALLLGGCTVGPKYVRPTADVPPQYKETGNWMPAQPSAEISKGQWWQIYGDPQLNALEEQVTLSNETLKAAQAQFLEARAAVRVARSPFFPVVTAGPSASRTRTSQNKPSVTAAETNNDLLLPIDVSYEPDVWGRVRRTVEAARSEAQATAADLASTDLSLHAELALDSEQQLLNSTVTSYQRALELTTSRYKGGIASDVDVAQAQTQLETTRAEAEDVA